MKRIALCLCVVLIMLSLTGCGDKATYKGDTRKIYINLLKKTIETTNVRFYDFHNEKFTELPNGTYAIISYGSYEFWITDTNGEDCAAHVNKAFNELPKSFRLYTNRGQTDWDEYSK